jgi:RNA-directed DNA polymerase
MTVHSIDGKLWKTKLDRISELSAKDKELKFNNLGHLLNLPLLKELYHRLDGSKAVGIDGMTKQQYGLNLDENLSELLQRIRHNKYHPKAARLVEIPKDDGSYRPLAISCLEDKLVQLAVNELLSRIYEPIFLPCSYGFRPNKSCHDGLRALTQSTGRFRNGAVVEIDLRKYFNSIPHHKLMECLEMKISDSRLLQLVNKLLKTPTLKDGKSIPNQEGCPQGSCLSPILANIYLHTVIDSWFKEISQTHLRARAEMVRYADDMIFVFANLTDAERFYKVLPKRLGKYGLSMHLEKSQLIGSGQRVAERAADRGTRLPTYKFLGFVCYWGKGRNGKLRLMYSSRADRFRGKLKEIKEYLRENLNTKDTAGLIRQMVLKIKGWLNYHSISDNRRRVKEFIGENKRSLLYWFRRRGGNAYVSWAKLNRILKWHNYPESWKTTSMFQRP